MKISTAVLCVLALALILTPSAADTTGRVADISGSLRVEMSDGAAPELLGPGDLIPDGARLVVEAGSEARIEIPGVGVLRLRGPATARIDTVEGVPAVSLLSGVGGFRFDGGSVLLVVAEGRLEMSGIAGHSGTLERGSSVILSTEGEGVRVEMRTGGTLFSGPGEHVRVVRGEARVLTAQGIESDEDRILLRSRDVEIMLPPDLIQSLEGRSNPALDEIEQAWNRDRESPRIP